MKNSFSIGKAFIYAGNSIQTKPFWKIVGGYILYGVILVALVFLGVFLMASLSTSDEVSVVGVIVFSVGLFLYNIMLILGVSRAALVVMDKKPLKIKHFFPGPVIVAKITLGMLLLIVVPVFLVSMFAFIALASGVGILVVVLSLGSVALVAYLWIKYGYFFWFIIDRNKGFISSWNASARITQGVKWKLALFFFFTVVLYFIVSIVLELILGVVIGFDVYFSSRDSWDSFSLATSDIVSIIISYLIYFIISSAIAIYFINLYAFVYRDLLKNSKRAGEGIEERSYDN